MWEGLSNIIERTNGVDRERLELCTHHEGEPDSPKFILRIEGSKFGPLLGLFPIIRVGFVAPNLVLIAAADAVIQLDSDFVLTIKLQCSPTFRYCAHDTVL